MSKNTVALAGGVGGAKLALGLTRVLSPDELTVVVNTGDDEEFYGLHVSPDLDTVMYTLAGIANPETGWGLAEDTFQALERLKAYGLDAWFGLGDKDLATHITRTSLLKQGHTLSEVTDTLRTALGVEHPIVPMTDDDVRTVVYTDQGRLAFQTYFVKYQCEPVVNSLRFEGADASNLSPNFASALDRANVLIFCPSNPFLSVAPILAVSGVTNRIRQFDGLRVAVSPIVGGQALRGPAAKMLEELGHDVSCAGVATQYQGLCDVFVIDTVDAGYQNEIEQLGMRVAVTNTVMNTEGHKVELARFVIELARDRS
ncbi:MAG: 2-phospho-L-lactate transferase [Chloroflexi bacterium]|nr:2-phospho-L-lactate transferase [Chloroflexota bacterium]